MHVSPESVLLTFSSSHSWKLRGALLPLDSEILASGKALALQRPVWQVGWGCPSLLLIQRGGWLPKLSSVPGSWLCLTSSSLAFVHWPFQLSELPLSGLSWGQKEARLGPGFSRQSPSPKAPYG
jgi:hypothetical protein